MNKPRPRKSVAVILRKLKSAGIDENLFRELEKIEEERRKAKRKKRKVHKGSVE